MNFFYKNTNQIKNWKTKHDKKTLLFFRDLKLFDQNISRNEHEFLLISGQVYCI